MKVKICFDFRCFLLAVGGVILDYSSQVALNPCESLLSDLLQGSDSLERGFSIYSGLMSLGACVGYLVTAIHWPWGKQEEAACTAALIFFLICSIATMLAVTATSLKMPGSKPTRRRALSWGRLELPWKYHTLPRYLARKMFNGFAFVYHKVIIIAIFSYLLILFKTKINGLLYFTHQVLLLPVSVWREVWRSPLVLWQLFVADTMSWAAATSYTLFYAHFVGQVVFAGNPNAPPGSLEEDLYNEGVRMGSWGLLLHSISGNELVKLIYYTVNLNIMCTCTLI